jgi:hypothetical protein
MTQEVLLILVSVIAGGLVTHAFHSYRERKNILVAIVESISLVDRREVPFAKPIGVNIVVDGNPVDSLHWVRILITNLGHRDLEDVVIDVAMGPPAQILAEDADLQSSLRPIVAVESPLAGSPHGGASRSYRFPVLNRDQVAALSFLVSLPMEDKPRAIVTCDHRGVEVVQTNSPTREDTRGLSWYPVQAILGINVAVLGLALWRDASSVIAPSAWVLLGCFVTLLAVAWGRRKSVQE